MEDVLESGKTNNEVSLKEPSPDTIYIFAYTSGTTGDPKGSMIPHSYFVASCVAIDYYAYNYTSTDIAISYLPYAHIFEQAIFCFSMFYGIKNGYY
jgi:long-chain acyl-CoA synthetase